MTWSVDTVKEQRNRGGSVFCYQRPKKRRNEVISGAMPDAGVLGIRGGYRRIRSRICPPGLSVVMYVPWAMHIPSYISGVAVKRRLYAARSLSRVFSLTRKRPNCAIRFFFLARCIISVTKKKAKCYKAFLSGLLTCQGGFSDVPPSGICHCALLPTFAELALLLGAASQPLLLSAAAAAVCRRHC